MRIRRKRGARNDLNMSKPVTILGAFLPNSLLKLSHPLNSHSNTTAEQAQWQERSWRDDFRAVLQTCLLRAGRFKFLDGWPSWGQGGWELCTSLCLHRYQKNALACALQIESY